MNHFSSTDFNAMRHFYEQSSTRSVSFRKQMLKNLRNAIVKYEREVIEALYKDLHKSEAESYSTEIGFCYAEISHAIKHIDNWMKPKAVKTPMALFPSSSKIVREAWGISLIIAPWNYPFQLMIGPLIGAIAGGNCSVLKPSEFTPNISAIIESLITETFDKKYITVIQGDGAVVVPELMKANRFDHVFFTGSIPVGKIIASLAAEKLIPTTLELGGKSPCVVDKNVDIKTAAARIVWGKFTNAGQTCVAPDYLLLHESRKIEFINAMTTKIKEFYGENPQRSDDYGRIVNEKRFHALQQYLTQGKIITGGETDLKEKYISPTIMEDVSHETALMKEEIFGPILPVITFNEKEEALNIIKQNPNPLSLYVFSNDVNFQEYFTANVPFGGGCINNTLVHLANPDLPFGGVGNSGSGQYHGQFSFETFTRPKAILKTATWLDPNIKYPPYSKWKLSMFRRMLR
jgi:aldehyde dehydrogenase (NAD+)